jgi:superfamily II RNA helicase
MHLKDVDNYKDKVKAVKGAQDGHKGGVGGKTTAVSFVHQMNEMVDILQKREALPAIFFVLSRKACELYASKVSATLLTSSETAALSHIISFHLHTYKALETMPQFHIIRDLLLRGIAFHHSGVLPVLKEIIEIAFSKGFVKLLFATETFAVGLNMPTKTVVFTGLKKYDSATGGMRMLRPDEYTQMAGRAGRRGKDKFGLVVYLPDRDPATVGEMKAMMKGGKPALTSRMDFHYDFLLKTLQSGGSCGTAIETPRWLQIMEQSYWFRQRQKCLAASKADLKILQEKLSAIVLSPEEETECAKFEHLQTQVANSYNAKKRQAEKHLNDWQTEHSGAKWTNAKRLFKTKKNLLGEMEKEMEIVRSLEAHGDGIKPVVEFLKKIDFLSGAEPEALTSKNLTLKGILATEINEGNPILMTELFLSGKVHDLPGRDLIAILACFLDRDEKEAEPCLASLGVSPEVVGCLEFIDDLGYNFQKMAGTSCPEGYWDLTTQWIDPILRWFDGDHIAAICADYGIFEGNFTRGILKLANLLDEWLALATYCQHTGQIEKIGELKALLVRDVVVPDSIYLRI